MRVLKPSALVVDEDLDIATLVAGILNDEGFIATIVTDISALYQVVERLEPDVVLLDIKGYADKAAWDAAVWLHQRPRPIPVIMFTTAEQLAEQVGVTPAGKAFVSMVPKPFDLQQLIDKVTEAFAGRAPLPKVAHVKPKPSVSELLSKRGVKDIRTYPDREWVVFRDKRGALVQIYWWEQASYYCISRMKPGAEALEDLGKCKTAEEAVQRALGF